MNIAEIIQLTSAVYILAVLGYAIFTMVRGAWKNTDANFNFNGYPAFILLIATIVCAITTLQVTP